MQAQIDDLAGHIFDGAPLALRAECMRWMSTSPRFRVFVTAQRDKIRKKARNIREPEGFRDLQLELDVAYSLLQDRRVTLEYEKYLAGKTRGPDFTVTFKGHLAFNVEVKRLRTLNHFGKWADALCDKLGQMPPSSINVLVVAIDSGASAAYADFDLVAAMARLRIQAERGDDALFARRGLHGARDYLRGIQRLSAMLLRCAWDDPPHERATLWLNAQAKHPLPPDLRSVLRLLDKSASLGTLSFR